MAKSKKSAPKEVDELGETVHADPGEINEDAAADWEVLQKLEKKIEDVLTLPMDTLIAEPREVFMFLLGEEAKRVARLEAVAHAAKKVCATRNGVMKPSKEDLAALEQVVVDLQRYEVREKEMRRLRKQAGDDRDDELDALLDIEDLEVEVEHPL